MENSEILIKRQLRMTLNSKHAKTFRNALAIAQESRILICKEKRDEKFFRFDVYCPTIDFAAAYFQLGALYGRAFPLAPKEKRKIKKSK